MTRLLAVALLRQHPWSVPTLNRVGASRNRIARVGRSELAAQLRCPGEPGYAPRMTDRVVAYYDGFNEWSRLDAPPGQLELLRALEILDRVVPTGSSVLDLGGGPGRYAIALARRGHRVTLADPSRRQLEVARERAVADGIAIEIAEADARDLLPWPDDAFDVVLAFGPFYHLLADQERKNAAAEIARVLRARGLLLAQVLPRLSGVRGVMERMATSPAQVTPQGLGRAVADGVFVNASDRGFPQGWYPRVAEARTLFACAGGIMAGREATLLDLRSRDPERFGAAMEVLRATARDPSVVDLGDYAVWIGRLDEPRAAAVTSG